jgi:hypothetical protein
VSKHIANCSFFCGQNTVERRIQSCIRNLRISCTAHHILHHRWENLNHDIKNWGDNKSSSFLLRSLHSSRPILPYHLVDLIWCNCPFNIKGNDPPPHGGREHEELLVSSYMCISWVNLEGRYAVVGVCKL